MVRQAIAQFLFNIGKISEQAASQAILVLSPRLQETPALGLAIQPGGRTITILALPRMAHNRARNAPAVQVRKRRF
jgi:hypothetical protein